MQFGPIVLHDVDVGDSPPVKQHIYRANHTKLKLLRKEIEYILANYIIEPSAGDWSSPCVLVPKKVALFGSVQIIGC